MLLIKNNLKSTFILVAIMLTVILFPVRAEADSLINQVSVSTSLKEPEEGMIQLPEFLEPGYCEMEVEWLTPINSISPGGLVKARLTLTPIEGYRFRDSTTVSVNNATITSKQISALEIKLIVKVGPLKYKLESPENVRWKSENQTIVVWDKVEHANGYIVKVYNDDKVVGTETVSQRSYDVTRFFNGESSVDVSVRAIGTYLSKKTYLIQSDEAFVGGNLNLSDRSTTYGQWVGNRYRISGPDEEVEYAKGWVWIVNYWYCFDTNGNLINGWFTDGEKIYYANKKGEMQSGWQKIDDVWYYFYGSGEMAVGWAQTTPNKWYYFDGNGKIQIGWILSGGKWYFMAPSGEMVTGWEKINGLWYYFYPDGHMAVNERIDTYIVNSDGVWVY